MNKEIEELCQEIDVMQEAFLVLSSNYDNSESRLWYLLDNCKKMLMECDASGAYKALQHKRDKKQLEKLKERQREENQRYSGLYGRYQELENKYTAMASAYSGIPLQYVNTMPQSEAVFYCSDTDAGAGRAIRAAEEKLKRERSQE